MRITIADFRPGVLFPRFAAAQKETRLQRGREQRKRRGEPGYVLFQLGAWRGTAGQIPKRHTTNLVQGDWTGYHGKSDREGPTEK